MRLREFARDIPWSLWAIALVAVFSHPLLLSGLAVPTWLLPAALLAALAIHRPERPRFDDRLVTSVFAVGFLAIAYGSIATADRSWDGLSTWTANARWLAVDGTLDHAYFNDRDVFQPARGYPLLQPILLASSMQWLGELGGRILFPLLWLLLVTGLDAPLKRQGLGKTPRRLAVLGLALVPMFIEPAQGGADSGFADLFLAALLLHAGVALVEDRLGLALATGMLLPLVKTEGAVHALILLGLAALSGRRRSATGFTAGTTIGLLLWLPLQHLLRTAGAPFAWTELSKALAPLAALAVGLGLHERRSRATLLGLLTILPLGVLAYGLWSDHGFAALTDQLGVTIQFGEIPNILGHTALTLVQLRKLGATFVLVIVTAVLLQRRTTIGPLRPLLSSFALIGITIIVFIATRPAASIDSFLQGGLHRYVGQWVGPAWLFCGLGWVRLQQAEQEQEPLVA